MEYHRLDLVDQGVESLEGLGERTDENFVVVNLQRNRLTNFEFFGTHPYLTEVQLQHNRIQSFRGLTKQVSLKSLHLQGCPVACHPYYRLMALLTIGFGLEDVDGLPITSHERHIANGLGKKAALAVSYGWLLDLHPRTNAEYDAIINKFRRLRREDYKRTQNGRLLSVGIVLTNLERMQRRRGDDAPADLQLAERQRTITRLAGRIAQLERMLAASRAQAVAPLPLSEGTVRVGDDQRASFSSGLLTAEEVALMDRMVFSRGAQLRHNLGTEQWKFERVCLQIDRDALTAESYMSRACLVRLALQSLRVRHVRPLTLVAEDPMGGTVEILFDSLPLLHTVYKALFLLRGRPVPLLSATAQSERQGMEQVRHTSMKALAPSGMPAASCRAPEVGQKSFWDTSSDRPVDEVQHSSRTPVALGSGMERGVLRTRASPTVDNVEDIPPLPAPYSRPGAVGRSHTDFSSIRARESHTADEVAKDNAAPETISAVSDETAPPAMAHAKKGVSKLSWTDGAGAHPAPQGSKGAASPLLDSPISDSVAFPRDAREQNCATEETVSVPGAGGRTVSRPRVSPLAPSAVAPLAGRNEASAPLPAPPSEAQAKGSSTTLSGSDRQGESGAGQATLLRDPAFPSVAGIRTHGGPSQSSSAVASKRRERTSTGDAHSKAAMPHGGRISAERVFSAAKGAAGPVASSRFRALLIDSDSD
ncbi:hypothetical protein LSCM1_00738 [Leishmania martiniquensis]|uniref:Leucine-rich repeat protein n=1 Tax=Leishmania martiniquensis TaxID=1580590 RepID=A0A836FKZ9_9TRYP|nr:hypothetical protein LSCM1_00738 [Leishmania martiniquensis]